MTRAGGRRDRLAWTWRAGVSDRPPFPRPDPSLPIDNEVWTLANRTGVSTFGSAQARDRRRLPVDRYVEVYVTLRPAGVLEP